jgi:uncharacterized protein YbjT (DUF2867 family)
MPSWETKLRIEDHMQALALPLTILRPMAFMELMTHKKFFPVVATWHVMPRLIGAARPVGWLYTDDLGAIAAHAFSDSQRFVGKDLTLVSDVQSLAESRALYHEVIGTLSPQLPMPSWLFQRFGFVGRDLTTMWCWLRTAAIDLATASTRAIHLEALTVRAGLSRQKAARSASQ